MTRRIGHHSGNMEKQKRCFRNYKRRLKILKSHYGRATTRKTQKKPHKMPKCTDKQSLAWQSVTFCHLHLKKSAEKVGHSMIFR